LLWILDFILHCNRCNANKMCIIFRCLFAWLAFTVALMGGSLQEENLPLRGRPLTISVQIDFSKNLTSRSQWGCTYNLPSKLCPKQFFLALGCTCTMFLIPDYRVGLLMAKKLKT